MPRAAIRLSTAMTAPRRREGEGEGEARGWKGEERDVEGRGGARCFEGRGGASSPRCFEAKWEEKGGCED